MRTHLSIALAFIMGLLFIAPTAAHADDHPAYLHALSDLREARGLLQKPSDYNGHTKWNERKAVDEIDAAIREIKKASIDDGKDLNDHPAIDASIHWGGRLKHARELLESAKADIEKREGNYEAKGLRRRAFGHIDTAIGYVRQGQKDKELGE